MGLSSLPCAYLCIHDNTAIKESSLPFFTGHMQLLAITLFIKQYSIDTRPSGKQSFLKCSILRPVPFSSEFAFCRTGAAMGLKVEMQLVFISLHVHKVNSGSK